MLKTLFYNNLKLVMLMIMFLGKIGFHLHYHKHMYKTREDYEPVGKYSY